MQTIDQLQPFASVSTLIKCYIGMHSLMCCQFKLLDGSRFLTDPDPSNFLQGLQKKVNHGSAVYREGYFEMFVKTDVQIRRMLFR